MWGAIFGDIVGSRFEFRNYKGKDFELLTPECSMTDDSLMTLALAIALDEHGRDGDEALAAAATTHMRRIGRRHDRAGFGGGFYRWLYAEQPKPYGSYGNGAAMRISSAGWYADSEEEVKRLSACVTGVTHNHPEGLRGAEAVATAIFLARRGASPDELKARIAKEYYPSVAALHPDAFRDDYRFDESCMGTVPQAFACVFASRDYIDCIRTAVSVGGDSDTLACIAGGIAEALYGLPEGVREKARLFVPEDMTEEVARIDERKFHGFRK